MIFPTIRSLKMQKRNLVKTKIAADYIDYSEATLERDRWRGGDIPYIKVGPRAIRYDLDQLDAYLESKTVRKGVSIMDKKEKTPNPPGKEELGESDTLLNYFSKVLYDKNVGVATLNAIVNGPYPSFWVTLAKERLVDMGVRI